MLLVSSESLRIWVSACFRVSRKRIVMVQKLDAVFDKSVINIPMLTKGLNPCIFRSFVFPHNQSQKLIEISAVTITNLSESNFNMLKLTTL